jgi:hypothetical protein
MIVTTISRVRAKAGRASVAAMCALALCAGGAFAARASGHRGHAHRATIRVPSIRLGPALRTESTAARFAFFDKQRKVSLQCSLDRARFTACSSPVRYGVAVKVTTRCKLATKRGRTRTLRSRKHVAPKCKRKVAKVSIHPLAVGNHSFRVRAKNKHGRVGRPATYRWTILEPSKTPAKGAPGLFAGASDAPAGKAAEFTISGQPSGLLYPGAPAQMVPLTVTNPNPVPIVVTGLVVTVAPGSPGCPSAENIEITQSDASASIPVVVPANGSVTLPAQGATAPAIQLLDLPAVNQNGCKGAMFALTYTGSAHS